MINVYNRAYQSTRMYREVRLRGQFIVDNTKLELLPNETLDEVIHAVWHLGGEQGSLGVFHITNYRIVWCLEADTSSNMSIPYVQMASVTIRIIFVIILKQDSIFTKDSKYGKALVIETTKASGHYVLGFRIDPPERVVEVFHKAERYFLDADANPYFGIEVCKENTPQSPQASVNILLTIIMTL